MSVNIKQSGSLKKIAAFLPNNLITVSSLPDTDITNIQAGQSLVYDGELSKWVNYSAKIVVTYTDSFKGETITCTKGLTVISKTAPLDSNTLIFYVSSVGTWVVASGDFSVSITVDNVGDVKYVELLSVPEGATVEPTDDIQIWLACANITDKSYTTLTEVLADRETFETLIADSNACDYMARSTTWAVNTVSAVPVMTDNTHPSGVASASSVYASTYEAWKVFDGSNSTYEDCWASANNPTYPQYLDYEFEEPVCINRVEYYTRNYNQSSSPKDVDLQAYDGSAWITLGSNTSTVATLNTKVVFSVNNYQKYSKYRFNIRSKNGSSPTYITVGLINYFEPAITTDQDAMALINKYDYCSNALLGNATWEEAIANSDYTFIKPLVPTMTSATTPSGEVISSTTSSGRDAYHSFAGANTGSFTVLNTANNAYIGYKFTEEVNVVGFFLHYRSTTNPMPTMQLQCSNTGVNDWVNVGEPIQMTSADKGTAQTDTPSLDHIVSQAEDEGFMYWRLLFSTSGSGYLQLFRVQFYGRASSEVLVPLVPTMTSDTTPSGECISSSNQSDTDAYMAFDQNDNTLWASNTLGSSWLGYTFTSKQKVSRFRLKYYADRVVPSVTVQGSDDGTTWNDIDTITTSTSADAEYSFDNNTSYYEYRLVFNMSSGVRATIYRVQFYSKTVQTNIVHSCANDTIYYMEDGSTIFQRRSELPSQNLVARPKCT